MSDKNMAVKDQNKDKVQSSLQIKPPLQIKQQNESQVMLKTASQTKLGIESQIKPSIKTKKKTQPSSHLAQPSPSFPALVKPNIPIIHVRDIRKVYQMGDEEVVALERINLKIYRGEICCIFGTSGSGKSTLLNQLAGMEKPTEGEVRIVGKNVSKMGEEELAAFRQKHIGFIFQSYNLLPTMTAIENVAMPLMFRGMDRETREKIAKSLLCKVGLSHRLYHYPGQMSGGQQQRAGIARAFVTMPKVVFADEPTGNLDSKTTAEIMKMISGFSRKYQQTIILVTHDPEMIHYADRIVTLVDGKIIRNERMNRRDG